MQTHLLLSRRTSRPSFADRSPSEWEGAGKAGCWVAPMVRVQQKARGRTTGTGRHPAFPAQRFYGLYVISSGTGLIAPVVRVLVSKHRRLDASSGAPGPHDFAVHVDRARHAPSSVSIAARLHVRDDAYAPFR